MVEDKPSGDPTRRSRTENVIPVGRRCSPMEETPKGRPCPLCGASMFHRHCKYVCPQHGVVYDCADTFY
ncbi:hypothetical protein ZOD2009_22172 [Haladaptatus paucihalophilus DX253]|uniref:Small CPxCG-related zinc finger protein n=2 Tax=Haladaptatus paucihalophilus DX253 TaxID=797209 RepID=E7R040_HALPU|nr:hypothetical protein ZOD2009_22172 [Haladaptatus paucihalophilus DX253]